MYSGGPKFMKDFFKIGTKTNDDKSKPYEEKKIDSESEPRSGSEEDSEKQSDPESK